MSSCYRFVVSGRVQGVYFRQTTVNEAQKLRLSGWVLNLPDGRVEGVACGEPEALEKLRLWLHRGPPAAQVESVLWTPADAPPTPGFVLRR
ncbi:MAG: acylphosphatase [Gammaproteobacteria bacterium]|nr:acylphosphatase [Gammaproteobacteria bacterium]